MTTETLRNSEQRTYIDIVDVCKLVRDTLKTHFGKFPFSVRAKRYSGGSSITVYWTDGPREKEVEKYIDQFCGADFDGMQGLKTYHDAETLVGKDGTVRHIHYGNDYIFTARTITQWETREAETLAYLRRTCHCDGAPPNDRFGNMWVSDLARQMTHARDYRTEADWELAARRVIMREEV